MRIAKPAVPPSEVFLTFFLFLLILIFASLFLTLPLTAQPPGRGAPQYDRSTEMEWRGKVVEVEFHESPPGFLGVHLQGTNEEGPLEIHAGPSFYLDEQGVAFKSGDELVVIGSRVSHRGKPMLLARRIVRGETTLELRSDRGVPNWPPPPPPQR